jgi:hypothetical protein
LSPLATLARGYAVITDGEGAPVTSVTAVKPGDAIVARLRDGSIHARYRTNGIERRGGERMSFEKKVQRLEEIVRALESKDMSLEKGLKLFEEGIAVPARRVHRIVEGRGRGAGTA